RSTLRMWSLWPGGNGDINSRSHGPVFRHGRARGESDSCHGHLRCRTGAASCRRSAPAVVLRTLQGALMFSGKRILAGASAVALAAGTTLAGAGAATAQDDDSTGSLSSSSIDFGEIATDLGTAAKALNGPVTVAPAEEGGPTVTYVNETDTDQHCLGFTAPYSTVIDEDLDTNYDPEDLGAALALVNALEDGGDISLLAGDEAGAPEASPDPNPDESGDVQTALVTLVFGNTEGTALVGAGEEVAWTAVAPNSPA